MTGERTLLVLGAGGQVGRELNTLPPPPGWSISGLTHGELDITDFRAVCAAVDRLRPAVIVNAAAYTAVDKAEDEPDRAFAVNRDGAANVAIAAAAVGAVVVHISTDYVFDGCKPAAYTENDAVCPLNVYGASKEAGERAVRSAGPRHVILRTAWIYATHGHNFLRTMLQLAAEREIVRVVADRHGTPTAASDIARAIVSVSTRLERSPHFGTYHLTNAGQTTWFGFAAHIFAALQKRGLLAPQLEAISAAEYPTPARRPYMSVLDCRKLTTTFAISMRPWTEAVDETLHATLPQPETT